MLKPAIIKDNLSDIEDQLPASKLDLNLPSDYISNTPNNDLERLSARMKKAL
jgi:hypothetical protein